MKKWKWEIQKEAVNAATINEKFWKTLVGLVTGTGYNSHKRANRVFGRRKDR